ncbi:CBS domain-containing protein [Yinghuangia sp. YIM S09857]|uniref:CBS domain-containing protein n=1 Tax=Yinghuangia sp. YIM S09857 TaxID=3436929 RepID=UPI003F536358
MKPVQTHPDPARDAPAVLVDASYASGPRVGADMTVEVALAVMAGALAEHLLLCDEDDQCTGLVTRALLAAVRDSPSYTDDVRLRDVIDANEAFAAAAPETRGAELAV